MWKVFYKNKWSQENANGKKHRAHKFNTIKQRRNSLATSKAENACLQGHQLVIIVLQ